MITITETLGGGVASEPARANEFLPSPAAERAIEKLRQNGLILHWASGASAAIRHLSHRQEEMFVVVSEFALETEVDEFARLISSVGFAAVHRIEDDGDGGERVLVFLAGGDLHRALASEELSARIEAALRSATPPATAKRNFISKDSRIVIDRRHQTLVKDEIEIPISHAEYELLCCLIHSPLRIWSRQELLMRTNRGGVGRDYLPLSRTIDAHIKNLRKKIEDNPRKPAYLLTKRGRGYRFAG